jgi:recombination associated protein RdgC
MGFTKGSITFSRFKAATNHIATMDADTLLSLLSVHSIARDCMPLSDRTTIGWTTGDHILDVLFSREKNVIADGLLFAMRVDTNKAPADLIRSYQRQNEAAMLEASGREFLSRAERREAREQAVARADAEARGGVFHRMKEVPAFWDLTRREVYLASTGHSATEQFMNLFRATFDACLTPISAGRLAEADAPSLDLDHSFDECRPAQFVPPPDGQLCDDSMECATKDFLGTEWLTWLWYAAAVGGSQIHSRKGRACVVMFERSVQMQCAFGLTGKLSLQADDATRLPESTAALAEGKRPVRVGLQLAGNSNEAYSLDIRGDLMRYHGVKLPPTENSVGRAMVEERIEHLRELIGMADDLYMTFLSERLSDAWPNRLASIRSWITGGTGALREAC